MELEQSPISGILEDMMLNPTVGNMSWQDQRTPQSDRLNSLMDIHRRRGHEAPWEEVQQQIQTHLPDINPSTVRQSYEQGRGMQQARERVQHGEEGTGLYLLRRALPFVSAGWNLGQNLRVGTARRRMAEGNATQEDYDRIATQERLDQIERTRTTGESIVSGAAHIPAIIGEAVTGSAIIGRGTAALGLGASVGSNMATATLPRVGMLSAQGLLRTASAAPAWSAHLAATTALMPSMWLGEGSRRTAESEYTLNDQGQAEAKDPWYNIKNYPAAFGLGMLQVAVLGAVGGVGKATIGSLPLSGLTGGVAKYGLGVAAGTATGLTGQQIVDVLASATGLHGHMQTPGNEGYGIIGALYRKDADEAYKLAAVQAATFALFSMAHGAPKAEAKTPGPVLEAYQKAADALRSRGLSEREIGRQLNMPSDRIAELTSKIESPSAEEGKSAFAGEKDGPVKTLGHELVDILFPSQKTASGPEAGIDTLSIPGRFSPALEGKVDKTAQNLVDSMMPEKALEQFKSKTANNPEYQKAVLDKVESIKANEARYERATTKIIESIDPQATLERFKKNTTLDLEYKKAVIERAESRMAEKAPDTPDAKTGKFSPEIEARIDQFAKQILDSPDPETIIEKIESQGKPEYQKAILDRVADLKAEKALSDNLEQMRSQPEALVPSGETPIQKTSGVLARTPDAKAIEDAKAGWKLHLATDSPEEVSKILQELKITHKVGRSGGQEGKDLTVYIGSREAAKEAARAIQEKAGHLLNDPHGETVKDNIAFTEKVTGRFDIGRVDKDFHQYGEKGTPFLLSDMDPWNPKTGRFERADAELTKRYGEYYTGKKEATKPLIPETPGVLARTPGNEAAAKMDRNIAKQVKSAFANESDPAATAVDAWRQINQKRKSMGNNSKIPLDQIKSILEDMVAQGKAKKVETPGEDPIFVMGEKGEDGNMLFHTGQTPIAPTGEGAKGPGQFEVNATIDHLLDVANYNVKNIAENPNASAATNLLGESVRTKKLQAGNPEIRMEEAAHILAGRTKLEVDPAKLPPEVREGLRQFYNNAIPQNLVNARVMHEGFAAWAVKRMKGDLTALTVDQKAASDWAEQHVQKFNLADPLNKIGEVYQQFSSPGKAKQYEGTISQTGKPAESVVKPTIGQTVADTAATALETFQERIENNLAVLGRMVKDAVSKGMDKTAAGARAMSSALAYRYQSRNWAADWVKGGYPELQADGSLKPASKSYADALARLKPGEESAYNAYAKARETVTDYQLEGLRADAARKAGTKVESPTVTLEQHNEAQAVLRDLRKNPEQYGRFEETNKDRIAVSNQGLRFLAQIGFFEKAWVEEQIQKRPDYVSRERVFDQMTMDFLDQPGISGTGRSGKPSMEKSRGLSGEQTRPAMETFLERFSDVAALTQKQLIDNPVTDLLRKTGMEKWAREMKADEAEDSTKPIWRTRENGKPVRFMVADKALWDYLSNRQGEGKASVQIANWLAKVPILNLVPKAIRLGATAASPLWHAAEMVPWRGPATFFANTMDMTSARKLPAWFSGWAEFIYKGALSEGREAKPYMEFYQRLAGDSHRFVTQGEGGEAFSGFPAFAKEVLRRLSYPEQVPRALEMKNMLDSMGIDSKQVEHWNKSGEMPSFAVQEALLNASAEITHNYQRRGTDVNAWNKTIPFLAAHVANTSKWIRNWQSNPKGAATAVAGLIALRVAHWLWRKDDQDYQEQSVGTRNDFLLPTPFGSMRISGPRGPDVLIGALIDESLRWASRSNPHFDRVMSTAVHQVMPGIPEPYSTVAQTAFNQNVGSGIPIVPHRDEGMGMVSNAVHHQLPFLGQRLTGGMVSAQNPAVRLFTGSDTPHQSVTDWYNQLHTLEAARTAAANSGQRFDQERQYQILHAISGQMRDMASELRGEPVRGSTHLRPPSDERQRQIRQRQVQMARQALARLGG